MREKIYKVLPLILLFFQIRLRKLTRYAKCSGYVERRFDVVFGHNLHIWHRLLFQASHFSFLQNRFYWSAWKKYENIFILNQNILKHFLLKILTLEVVKDHLLMELILPEHHWNIFGKTYIFPKPMLELDS